MRKLKWLIAVRFSRRCNNNDEVAVLGSFEIMGLGIISRASALIQHELI